MPSARSRSQGPYAHPALLGKRDKSWHVYPISASLPKPDLRPNEPLRQRDVVTREGRRNKQRLRSLIQRHDAQRLTGTDVESQILHIG